VNVSTPGGEMTATDNSMTHHANGTTQAQQRPKVMASKVRSLSAIILFSVVTVVSGERRLKHTFYDDVKAMHVRLLASSINVVNEVLESGTPVETRALQAAFRELPQSDFKVEILFAFLDQPDRFWGKGDIFFEATLEGASGDALSMYTAGYVKEHFDIDLVRTTLFFTAEGRKQIAQMIRDKLEGRDPPPPESPVSALEPQGSGNTPAPVSKPIGTSTVEVEPHRKRPLWIVMVFGAVAVAVGAVFILRARRGRG